MSTNTERIDPTFKRELDELKAFKLMTEGKTYSVRRLTKAIRRHSQWQKIKEDIKFFKLEDDRKK